MPDHVYKLVELVGSSEESVTKAIEAAIAKAALTLRHLEWFEVAQILAATSRTARSSIIK